jgi:hypothetical protein
MKTKSYDKKKSIFSCFTYLIYTATNYHLRFLFPKNSLKATESEETN